MSSAFKVVDTQRSFSGGLNTTADPMQLADNEVSEAQNARITTYGAVTMRRGSIRVHTSAIVASATVQGGVFWTHAGKDLAVVTGGVYQATCTSLTGVSMAWTSIAASGLSTTVKPVFAEFVDTSGNSAMYIADGGALNKVVSNTLTTNIASTPSVAFICVYNQRLWGISGDDETLYWSGLNNGDTLGVTPDGGSAIVRTFGQQKLKALLPIGNSLMLIHERGISAFTGWSQDDFNVATGTRGISPDVGTSYPHTVIAVENIGFFLSERGVYSVTESGVQEVSRKIEKTLIDAPQTNWSRALAVPSPLTREVWFYIPDTGFYVYNYRLNAWMGQWDTTTIVAQVRSTWLTRDAGTLAPVVLLGGSDGFVRWMDETGHSTANKDDYVFGGTGGSAYSWDVKSHPMFFGDPTNYVHHRFIWITGDLVNSTTTAVGWETPHSNVNVTLTSGLFGEGTTPIPGTARVGAWGQGRVPHYLVLSGDATSGVPLVSTIRVEGFAYPARAANVT